MTTTMLTVSIAAPLTKVCEALWLALATALYFFDKLNHLINQIRLLSGFFRCLSCGLGRGFNRFLNNLCSSFGSFLSCGSGSRLIFLYLRAANVAVDGVSGDFSLALRALLLILDGIDMSVDDVEVLLELLYIGYQLSDLSGGVNAEYLFLVGILTDIAELLVDFASYFGGGNLVL